MAVHFKFKSAKDYASVPIEGHFISIASLKEKIFEKMKLSRACDFDLLIANAQTNEEYTEGFLVPENTSVLVRRVPGNPCWPILTDHQNEQHYEGSSKSKAAETVVELDKHVSKPETAASMDDFGVDLYEEPDDHTQVVSSLIKADEDDKIKAFIDASESEWQRQTDVSGSGGRSKTGFGKGFVNGSQWKSPPQGYICFRCGVAGHFIHFCPTNGDPTFNTKKIKQPTGIPKTMLEANPDGSYALPNGEIAIMKPNEEIFEKEIHNSPATRILGDIPAEFLCALCHNVLHDAVLTSKCCCKSYCDRCIRSEFINKGCCSCGAKNVLADDLLPNRTLREAIQRLVESKANNSEPSHAKVQVEDSPRVHQKTGDIHTFSRTNGNFAHKISDNKRTFGRSFADGPAKTRGVFTKHWMRGQATYGRQTMGFNKRGYHRTQRRGMPFSGGMSYNKDAFLCTGFWPGSQYVEERMPAYGNPHKAFRSGDNDIPFGGLVMTPQPYGPPLLMRPIIYGVSGPTNVMSREEFEAKKEEQRRRLEIVHKPEIEHNNGRSSERISERSGYRAKSEQKHVSRSQSPVQRKRKERLSRSRSPTERKWEDSYETSNHKSVDQRQFSRSRSPIGRRRGTYNCSPEEMHKRKVPDRVDQRASPINTRQHMQDMPDRGKPREKYSDRYSTDQEEYSERYDSDHETSSRRGMSKIDRWEDRHCQSQQSMPRHYGSHELEEDAATRERSYKNCDNSSYRKTDFQKHRMSLSPQRTSAQSLGQCTKRLDARDYQHDYSDFRRQGSQSAGETRAYQGPSLAQRPQSYDEEYQNGYDTHGDERWRLKEVKDDKTVLSRNIGPSSFVGNQQKNRRLKQKARPSVPRKFMTGSVNASAGFMPQENIRTTRSSEPCNYEQVSTSERVPIKSFGQNYQQARSTCFYKGTEYQDTNEPSENLYKCDNGSQGRDYMRAPRVAQHSNDFKIENIDEERAYLQASNPYGAEQSSSAWELKEPSKFHDDRTVLSKRVGPRLVTGNLQKRLQRTRRVNRGLASQFRLMTDNNVENMLAQPNIPTPATNGQPNSAARLSVVVRTNTNGKPQRACRVVTNNASKLNGIARKKRTVEYCGPNRCVVRILDKSKEAKAIRAQKITRRIQMTSNANGNRIVVNAANGAFKQTDERPQNSVFNRISFGIAGPQAVNQVSKRKRNLANGVFVGRGGKRVKRQC